MSFYGDIANAALDVLKEFGAVGQWTHVEPGVYDPATGLVAAQSSVVDVHAAVFDYEARNIDGTRILVGDKQVIMQAGRVGKADDIFTWQGIVYRVIGVKDLAPAGETVIIEAQVRR